MSEQSERTARDCSGGNVNLSVFAGSVFVHGTSLDRVLGL